MGEFIDYLSLMLLNMTAGFVVLAFFLLAGLNGERKRWVAPFAMVGLVAFLGGLHMIFAWPLPGPYNSAFGETSVLFGVIFLGIALSLAKDWNLAPISIYGVLSGLVAVLLGVRIMILKMTLTPEMTGIGFILSGAGGILAMLAFCAPGGKVLRQLAMLVLFGAAAIWALTGYGAYWTHMSFENFMNWKPATMMSAPATPASPQGRMRRGPPTTTSTPATTPEAAPKAPAKSDTEK